MLLPKVENVVAKIKHVLFTYSMCFGNNEFEYGIC